MRGVYPESQAPPHDGPRRWITCPECGSTDEASDTPCTNLACPSLARRHERVEERIEAACTWPRAPSPAAMTGRS
jgi:hypothetical protein